MRTTTATRQELANANSWAPPTPPVPPRRRRRRWPGVTLVAWTAMFGLWMAALANVDPDTTGDPTRDAAAEFGNDLGQAVWGTVSVFVWLLGVIVLLLAALVTRRRT